MFENLRAGEGWKRQPFVWLALAAVGGTLLGEIAPWPSWVSLAVAGVFGLWTLRRHAMVLALVAGLFCAKHQIDFGEARARGLAELLTGKWRMVEVEGAVISFPETDAWGRQSFRFKIDELTVAGATVPGPVPVIARWEQGNASYGDRIRFRARIRNVAGPRNLGEFDYRSYLNRRGIWSEIGMAGQGAADRIGRGGGSAPVRLAGSTRSWMRQKLKAGLEDDPERASLIESMVLGVTEDATPEVERVFRETGTLHLFAVSGLNVAMFGMIAWAALSPLGLGRRVTAALVIPVVLFYALVTGLTPSGVRAAVMAAVILGGIVFDRRAMMGNTLGVAAFVILGFDGNQLFQTGCQLSFGVVLALMAWAGPMGRFLAGLGAPDPFLPKRLLSPWTIVVAGVSESAGRFAGVCAAAWLGALPLNVLYFQMISPVALAANLLAVPIAFAVLATGTIGVLGGIVSGWLATVFSHSNWLLVGVLLDAVRWCAAVPFGHAGVGWPEFPGTRATMELFDVRDGGANLIQAGGETVLVDAGRDRDYRRTLFGYLQRRGIGTIDAFYWTHGDVAHLGGAAGVIREKRVRLVMESSAKDRSSTRRAARLAADALKIPRRAVSAGDRWTSANGRLALSVLYPPGDIDRPDADDEALVLLAEMDGLRVLMMSDAGFIAERWLLERGVNLRADVLVKGVHSRDPSGGRAFLEAVKPSAVVCGYDAFLPESGIPSSLEADLKRLGARLFRMDQTGGVTLRLLEGGYELKGFCGGAVFVRVPQS
jgi:ComEC/Rec2-related protein